MVDDVLRCSVPFLMATFRESLLAVLPTAERLQLTWADDHQHPDWEILATRLFDVCVRNPIDVDYRRRCRGLSPYVEVEEFRLANYDIDYTEYARFSRVAVATASSRGAPTAFVRYRSLREPFDTVQVAVLHRISLELVGTIQIPYEQAVFSFLQRAAGKPDEEVHQIEADD